MNRTEKIEFRVTAHEKRLTFSKVKKSNMKLSDYCRKAVMEKEIQYIEGLPDCVYELNKIGNNINQIATAANQGRDVAAAMTAIKNRMFQTLDKIDCVLGGESYSDSQAD